MPEGPLWMNEAQVADYTGKSREREVRVTGKPSLKSVMFNIAVTYDSLSKVSIFCQFAVQKIKPHCLMLPFIYGRYVSHNGFSWRVTLFSDSFILL